MSIKQAWINTIYRIATGSRKYRNIFTPVGAFIYGGLIFIFVYAALSMDKRLSLTTVISRELSIILSLPLFLIASILIVSSVLCFIRVKGTPVPFNPPPALVITGPYYWVRNPMLSGAFALLFGFGFLYASISLLVFFTPLFIIINIWELKSIEEPELEKRLGQVYRAYRRRTPMFFPGYRFFIRLLIRRAQLILY